MRFGVCDCDRLHFIGFIKPVAEFCIGRGFARLVTNFFRVFGA